MTWLITIKWSGRMATEETTVGNYLDIKHEYYQLYRECDEIEWIEIHRKYSDTNYVFMNRFGKR